MSDYLKRLEIFRKDGYTEDDIGDVLVDIYNKDLWDWLSDDREVYSLTGLYPYEWCEEGVREGLSDGTDFWEYVAVGQYLFWLALYNRK